MNKTKIALIIVVVIAIIIFSFEIYTRIDYKLKVRDCKNYCEFNKYVFCGYLTESDSDEKCCCQMLGEESRVYSIKKIRDKIHNLK